MLVDNDSGDESVSYLKEAFPDLVLLESGGNLGYAGGNNIGVRYALDHGADAILILNNDTILHPNCIEEFVNASEAKPNSVLGGKVYYYDEPEIMQHFGGIWNSRKGKFKNVPSGDFNTSVSHDLDFVTGCALFVPRKIFEVAGLMEDSFFLYYEEIDWCFHVRKCGFSCTYVPGPILWHKESRSFAHPKPPQSYFQWRNRLLFIERNFSKSEYYLWILTKLPKRYLFLRLKKILKTLDTLVFGTTPEKQISLLSYQASLAGIRDYFARKFGNGPSWIYTKVK